MAPPNFRSRPRLSASDHEHLDSLEPKLQLVRDRVLGVCNHHSTGLYLWGEGGTSKSYTVMEALQNAEADYILHNSRMTGRGLVDTLAASPASIHVLEDAESMFGDKRAWGVLRSALWSQSKAKPPERRITWTAYQTNIDFLFTGGIILIANRELKDIPELAALQTRIPVLKLAATFDEIAALMRSVAVKGYHFGPDSLPATECYAIAEWLIDKMRAHNAPLDMRLMVGGFHDFIQWKTGHSQTHWEDLLHTRIQRQTLLYKGRAQRISEERVVALEVHAMSITVKEKEKLFMERTGKSVRAMYRRLEGT